MDNTIENLLKDMEELRKRILSIKLPNAKENDLLWLVTSIEQDINKLEQPQGEWVDTNSGYKCSVCGASNDYAYDEYKHKFTDYFCPNCGARMKQG